MIHAIQTLVVHTACAKMVFAHTQSASSMTIVLEAEYALTGNAQTLVSTLVV